MLADQQPVASPFGFASTAADVVADIDLTGKTVLITGGYSGIGLETANALAGRGAKIILPVRRSYLIANGIEGLAAQDAHILYMDLADPASVRACAAEVRGLTQSLDILINNAGIMAAPEQYTPQGYELQFATNHLGHFLLTALLMPLLLQANGGARVVSLASTGHKVSPVVFDDIHFKNRPYDKWLAYGQAKTANALFAVGLSKRFKNQGVEAFSVHPGGIMSNLQRDMAQEELVAMGWVSKDGEVAKGFKTPAQGAATTTWAATSPLLKGKGGVYCEDCNIAVADSKSRISGVNDYAVDETAADRLWEISEQMVGEAFK